MSDKSSFFTRITVRVKALLSKHWLGSAGRRFRQTTTVISDYTHEKIRPAERLAEAPDLGWKALQGAALEKHARALKEYAEEETERVEVELRRKTLDSKVRQEKATADKLESEARTAQIVELQERIKLLDNLKRVGAIPIWDEDGNMRIVKAAPDFAWDGLQEKLLKTGELPALSNTQPESQEETKTD